MTTNKFNSFAVWGAGNLGKHLVTELLSYKNANPGIRVTVLARHESKDSEKNLALAAAGATVVPWDPTSPNAPEGLKDIDVFLCAVSGQAAPLQVPAAHAAKKAGVKAFVPNDWGTDIYAANSNWHKAQQTAREGAIAAGVPITSFYCGFWPDVLPAFGFDVKAGKIDIAGDGTAHLSLSGTQDAARFAAYVLANLSSDQLVGRTFQYQAEYITSLELAEELEKASPKPLKIVHTPIDALKVELAEREAKGAFLPALVTGCRLAFAAGAIQLDQGKLDNDLWPQWKPKRAVDIMKDIF